jgi:tetratricopeptide (TPR) repeat protein
MEMKKLFYFLVFGSVFTILGFAQDAQRYYVFTPDQSAVLQNDALLDTAQTRPAVPITEYGLQLTPPQQQAVPLQAQSYQQPMLYDSALQSAPSAVVPAQRTQPVQIGTTQYTLPVTELSSQFYHVISDGDAADAGLLLEELEQRFQVYNDLFWFDTSTIKEPLTVRAFANKDSFNSYVLSKLNATREGAVYLHYAQADRRELVIHRGSASEPKMLPHQAFIQFLRAFIPYPPSWMREGFAIYFNNLVFDKYAYTLRYEENLSWLETIKNLGVDMPTIESILLADQRGAPEYFQPVSWALVSFLLNSENPARSRALTESFLLLKADKSAGENAAAIVGRLYRQDSAEAIQKDFTDYIQSRKTFAELVSAGTQAYSIQNFVDAEKYFILACNQKPDHYAAYYYLGLLAYENKNYDASDWYYHSALQFGADPGLVYYALGINAAAAGRNVDAISYLEQAGNVSPDRYRDRVNSIIIRLR